MSEKDCEDGYHYNPCIDWEIDWHFGCMIKHKRPINNCKDKEEY